MKENNDIRFINIHECKKITKTKKKLIMVIQNKN